ncbi:MAG: hypothetical protein ACI97P_001763 [Arcticibacterium sp.]|jgi:hypothetical protein
MIDGLEDYFFTTLVKLDRSLTSLSCTTFGTLCFWGSKRIKGTPVRLERAKKVSLKLDHFDIWLVLQEAIQRTEQITLVR